MELAKKIIEEDLSQYFPEIQRLIKELEEKYPLPQDLFPAEFENEQAFVTQPLFTYQLHAVS